MTQDAPAPSTSTARVKKHRENIKVKLDFKKTKLSDPLKQKKKRLNVALRNVERDERIEFITEIVNSQSPSSKKALRGNVAVSASPPSTNEADTPIIAAYTLLKKKRDPVSNLTKRALISTLDATCSKRKV